MASDAPRDPDFTPDPERCWFLFRTDVAPVDVHEDGALMDWYAEVFAVEEDLDDPLDDGFDDEPDTTQMRAAFASVAANHVLFDDPPAAWAAVQRMRAAGLDDERAFGHLLLVAGLHITEAMGRATDADDDGDDGEIEPLPDLADRYALLPLPDAQTTADTIEALVADQPGLGFDDVAAATLEQLGHGGNPLMIPSVDATLDHLIDDGVLAMTVDDALVHAVSAAAESVLTHRINDSEITVGTLSFAASDLALFGLARDPVLDDGTELHTFSVEEGHLGWRGPDGWLDGYEPGQLLAVRRDRDGVMRIEVIDDVAPDPDTVEAFRREFQREAAATDGPVSFLDVAVAMYAADRRAFAEARAPLVEIADALGLDRDAGWLADDPSRWRAQEMQERRLRLIGLGATGAALDEVMAVLDRLEGPDLDAEAAGALRAMAAPAVGRLVIGELLGPGLEWGDAEAAPRIADALLAAARSPRDRAIANAARGLVAERLGDPVGAEQWYRAGLAADPTDGHLVDRVAWYAFDRGDAAGAARLWSMLERPDPGELDMARTQAGAATGATDIGRNDPCWCGSGRKYKKCHLGQPATVPLPDRVGWLCRKATSWIERSERYWDLMDETVATIARDHPDPSVFADDPLIIDVLLTELGGFDTFLAHRGPLLPDDELLLGQSWLLAERSVHEVLDVARGDHLVLRDLRSGETVEVRERSASRSIQVGELLCARVVPDGAGHQIIGGVLPVQPGQEFDVMALCDDCDGFGLLAWAGARRHPPRLTNREGEPTASFVVGADVADAAQARRALDELYGPADDDSDTWVERHAVGPDESIIRAMVTLDGRRLVAQANSRTRIDRVVEAWRGAIEGLVIFANEEAPLDLTGGGRGGPPSGLGAGLAGPGGRSAPLGPSELPDDLRTMIQERLEQNWLTEPVPALGGWTPTDAAADPTRREQVRRLIDSFVGPDDGEAFGLRPDVLRRALDL